MEKAYEYENERLNITDADLFIQSLHSAEEAKEHYKVLLTYANKQKPNIANDIPSEDWTSVVTLAIVKTIKQFKPGQASLQSFFWQKLRGEISGYRSKRNSIHRKILKAVNNMVTEEGKEIVYKMDKESQENSLDIVDSENMDEMIEREEKYVRQLKAFKMGYSGIPRQLQDILHFIGEGMQIKEVAQLMGLTDIEVQEKRNFALSLVLQRILRSKHLTEEDKIELAQEHNIEYTPEKFNFVKDDTLIKAFDQ